MRKVIRKIRLFIKTQSPFLSQRRVWIEWFLLFGASKLTRPFSLICSLCCRQHLKTPLVAVNDREVWLVFVSAHARERTFFLTFGDRIKRIVILGNEDPLFGYEGTVHVDRLSRDWLQLWSYVTYHNAPGRIFLLSGLSDLWFGPLRWHPNSKAIFFDAYDPTGDYDFNPCVQYINGCVYGQPANLILRDARFLRHIPFSIRPFYKRYFCPDAPNFPLIDRNRAVQKLEAQPLSFICSGWVTTDEDGGIIRSLRLIQHLWPSAVVHICFTKFMDPKSRGLRGLVEWASVQPQVFLHQDLKGEEFLALLDKCHVGLNLHDPNVFGEEYRMFKKSMIRRSPSARVLDFAVRGCVLMSTREHRFSIQEFRRYSPHGEVVNLASSTRPEELFNAIRNASKALSSGRSSVIPRELSMEISHERCQVR